MKKYVLPFLLTFSMIVMLLGGCETTETSATSESSASAEIAESAESTQIAPDGASTNEAETTPDESSDVSEPAGYTFPLSEEPVTYTWFQASNASIGTVINDLSENSTMKAMKELTNVGFDFITPAADSASERYNLLVAAADYPDVQIGTSSYYTAGGYDTAIEEGVIMDLTELAPECMPNYYAFLEDNDIVRKQAYTDSGLLWGVARVVLDQPPTWGPMIRQDWLDELALDSPVTLDDWEEILTAFSENYGGTLSLASTGYTGFFGNDYTIVSAFDCGTCGTLVGSPFINKDGTAVFTPATDGFKEYLELMADWYAKGLIYQDFASASIVDQEDLIASGSVGIFVSSYNTIDTYNESIGVEDAIRAIQNPVREEGQTLHLYMKDSEVNGGNSACIGGNVTDATTLLNYLDYWWTEEGHALANYGIEGETFEYDEAGNARATALMYANEDPTITFSLALDAYTMRMGPISYDWSFEYEVPTVSQASKETGETWMVYDADYVWPSVTLTADEAQESANQLNELNTYISEYVLKAITGAIDVDSTWGEYQDVLEQLGAMEVESVYQTALDRYLSR